MQTSIFRKNTTNTSVSTHTLNIALAVARFLYFSLFYCPNSKYCDALKMHHNFKLHSSNDR